MTAGHAPDEMGLLSVKDHSTQPALDELERIDALCDEFEKAWRVESRPDLNECLERVELNLRPRLLRSLLSVELELERREGLVPKRDVYLNLFPGGNEIVDEVFRAQMATNAVHLTLGQYELLERLGQGGMGTVYKARHKGLDKLVAVKLLPPDFLRNEAAVARFRREMQAVGRLHHPNIVGAMDGGEFDGVPYLVMEYVPGHDLNEHVRQRGPLSVNESVAYVIQAAEGLEYAHQQGIIHRDVKPGNLLLCDPVENARDQLGHGEFGRIKILDLGLARLDDCSNDVEALTTTGTLMGTVDYMSPEQAEDMRRTDARSDIYSLGCTLFFLLTGQPPFSGATPMSRLLAHREQHIPLLSSKLKASQNKPDTESQKTTESIAARSQLHPRPNTNESPVPLSTLDQVLQRMLAKRPEDRFASMRELVEILRGVQVGQSGAMLGTLKIAERTVVAHRPPFRWFRLIATALSVSLILLGIVSPWLPHSANQSNSGTHSSRSDVEPAPDGTQTASTESAELVNDSAERAAALWVLGIGGMVDLILPNGTVSRYESVSGLPTTDFAVDAIHLAGNRHVTDLGLQQALLGLTRLRCLWVQNTKITDSALVSLKNSPTLENLQVAGTGLSDVGVMGLGILPKLTYLSLPSSGISEKCLASVTSHPQLTNLTMLAIPASESAAELLLARPRWQGLGLHGSWFGEKYAPQLAANDSLNWLQIVGGVSAGNLERLGTLPKLSYLMISDIPRWTPELSSALGRFPTLVFLDLVNVGSVEGWSGLASARPWQTLSFTRMSVADELFDALNQSPSLTQLILQNATLSQSRLQRFSDDNFNVRITTDTTLNLLDRTVAKQVLGLGGCHVEVFNDAGAQRVSALDQLPSTSFRLKAVEAYNCPSFNNATLASLEKLGSLQSIVLYHTSVTDEGLAVLERFPKLGRLSLDEGVLTPNGLATLAKLRKLSEIVMPICSVDLLSQLSPLDLRVIGYERTVGDPSEVFSLMASLFPNLNRLHLGQTIPNRDAAAALANLTKLEVLGGCAGLLEAEVVEFLSKMPALVELQFFGSHLGEWPPLATLARIERILVSDGSLSRSQLERLAELPNVKKITLGRVSLSPESLNSMSVLNRVPVIQFQGCALSEHDRSRVAAALPHTAIIWR